MKLIDRETFYDALDKAYDEVGNVPAVRCGRPTGRVYNSLMRAIYRVNAHNEPIDISILESISDRKLLSLRGIGESSVRVIRRAIDILNGAEPINDKKYGIVVSDSDIKELTKLIDCKTQELVILKKILNSAERIDQ